MDILCSIASCFFLLRQNWIIRVFRKDFSESTMSITVFVFEGNSGSLWLPSGNLT